MKILDFGLARFTLEHAAEQTGPGVALGTPAYMAPEQRQDVHSADIRADIYSLGRTLVFLLTGKPDPRFLAAVQSQLPSGLEPVINRMLAQDPPDRFETPDAAAAALMRFTGQPLSVSNRSVVRRLRQAVAILSFCGLIALGVDRFRDRPAGGVVINPPPGETESPKREDKSPDDGIARIEIPKGGSATLVHRQTTTIQLEASSNPVARGRTVTSTATVAPKAGVSGVPTGKVTFRIDGTGVSETPLANGKATFMYATFEPGDHIVQAEYKGDGEFGPCQSETLKLSVFSP